MCEPIAYRDREQVGQFDRCFSALLAMSAEIRASLPLGDVRNGSTTDAARLARPAVNAGGVLKIAELAVCVGEVAQGRAARSHRFAKCRADFGREACTSGMRKFPAGSSGVDPCAKQRLAGVDVAHSCNDRLIEQQELDRSRAPMQFPVQGRAIKILTQRLRPETCKQWMWSSA